MRYATVTLSWNDGRPNPNDGPFGRSEAISIEAIRYLNPVSEDDDRYVELLELRGDLERARTLLEATPDALEFDIAGDGTRGVAYVQRRTVGPVGDLLSILQTHELVVDWPLSVVDSGDGRALELTIIGTDRAIQRAAADLPDGVVLDVRRLGDYDPNPDHDTRSRGAPGGSPVLTDRQRELFELAWSEGYYEVPRQTTQRDLADELDLAAGTVGEHIQRIESKLAAAYARPRRQ